MKMAELLTLEVYPFTLTLLHSERPKSYMILAFLSATGLKHHSVKYYNVFLHYFNKPYLLLDEYVPSV